MILKSFQPYFISILFVLLLHSCEKKQTTISKKNNSWKRSKVERKLIDSLSDIGDSYVKKTDLDSAYYFYYRSKIEATLKKDTSRIIYANINLVTLHLKQTDYYEAENTLVQTIPLLKSKPDHYYNFSLYNTLGCIYMSSSNFKSALDNFNKARLCKNINLYDKNMLQLNIAWTYMLFNKHNEAICILEKLILQKSIKKDPFYAMIIDNLGYSYFKIGVPKALYYLKKSYKLRSNVKHNELIGSYLHLGEYYQNINQKKSNEFALLGYKISSKIKSVDDRILFLKLLIKNSSSLDSKKYALKYLQLNDSITIVRQNAKNQFAKIKYDFKEFKKENEVLKAQKALQLEQEKNKNIIICFSAFIAITTIVSLLFFFIKKNKKVKIRASYETETRIAKKLHDELANDVYHTMAFSETQDLSNEQNKEAMLSNLEAIYNRIRNISKENSSIDTNEKYLNNLKEMISGFSTNSINIIIQGIEIIKWESIEKHKKIAIYRVLQELLVNMKKHSQCTIAIITFKKMKNGILITYSDNGIGTNLDNYKSKNGLQNVENRIYTVNGNIVFDSKINKGFKANFSVPI